MAARLLLLGLLSTLGLITGKIISGADWLGLGREPPGRVTVGRGRYLELPCGPVTAPNTSVIWLKDDVPLQLTSRIWQAVNGSLIFNKIVHKKNGPSDAGRYQCIFKNSHGALLSRPSQLIIPGLSSEWRKRPDNKTTTEGDTIRLVCSIESTPPATYLWLKDDQPLPHNKRFAAFDTGILYITNIREEDAGNYRCQAKNPSMKKIRLSEVGTVTVLGNSGRTQPPTFLEDSPSASIALREDLPGALVCAVSGVPKPSLAWVQSKTDGTNVTHKTTNIGLNIFKLNKVTAQYSGVYTCIASQTSREKIVTISKKVIVSVETPPVIVKKPSSQMFPAAKTVRIDCEVRGHPQPQVVWYKDGYRLHINGRIKQKEKELVLGGVVSQDTGLYQCFAGEIWAGGRLEVSTPSDQPQPPTNLTCLPLSPTQIRLLWSPIQPTVKAYTVHYFPTEGGDEGKDVSLNNSYVVTKLQPYTNYTFYIRSYGRSASEQSLRVVCSTGEAVPTGGAQVKVTVTGSHCLVVDWSPPPVTKARGAITSYKVQWKKVGQTSVNFHLLPSTVHRYRISGLERGERYMVRVIGATSLGWPEHVDGQSWINVTLPSVSSASFPPPYLFLVPVNSSAIKVDWSYDGPRTIDGFHLSYKKVNGDREEKLVLLANISSYTISHLEPESSYEVSLSAYSGTQVGEICTETAVTAGGISLAGPSSPEAVPTSPHSMRISWKPPPGSVGHYHLQLRGPHPSPLRDITVKGTEVEVEDLKANTVYEVTLRAVAPGNLSIGQLVSLECSTLPEAVERMVEPKWKAVNTSSVLVWWNPVATPVLGYTILYTVDVDMPTSLWQTKSVPANTSHLLLTSLWNNKRYALRIRGIGPSGPGPLSPSLFFTIPLRVNTDFPPLLDHPKEPSTGGNSDQFLGILIGCSISVVMIVACTATLIYRRRCIKPPRTDHEMTTLSQLDNKASYHCGQINGVKAPLVCNGRLPNGHSGLRITENPQEEVCSMLELKKPN